MLTEKLTGSNAQCLAQLEQLKICDAAQVKLNLGHHHAIQIPSTPVALSREVVLRPAQRGANPAVRPPFATDADPLMPLSVVIVNANASFAKHAMSVLHRRGARLRPQIKITP